MSTLPLIRLLGAVLPAMGRKLSYAALPLYFAVGIGAVLLFAGNGMDAAFVTAHALASYPVRLLLLGAWSIATLPLARSIVFDRDRFFLRSLPVPRAWWLGIDALASALVQLAWGVLWVRGAGVLGGAIAVCAVLAAQSCVLAGLPRSAAGKIRPTAGIPVAAVLLSWYFAPSPLGLALLLPTYLLEHRRAWLRAPEPRSEGWHAVVPRGPALATSTALAASACRSNASAIARALAVATLGCALTIIGILHNPEWTPEDGGRCACALWGAASMLGAAMLARPLLRAETQLGWVLDVCSASRRLRALASILLLATLAGACGVAFALAVCWATGDWAAAASWSFELLVTGASFAAIAVSSVRITTQGRGRDSSRLLLILLSTYASALLLLAVSLPVMLAFSSAAAFAVSMLSTRFDTPRLPSLG
jgi:hypothetical protein